MVEQKNENLNNVFRALADPTRRQMISHLAKQDLTVTDLASPFQISLAAVSKHIKVLEEAGLIHRTIQGRIHTCRLEPKTLAIAYEWIQFYERFWTKQLDALEDELNKSEIDMNQRRTNDE